MDNMNYWLGNERRKQTSLIVGEFQLRVTNGRFSIHHNSGEGGEFNLAEFEKVVKEFFDENF